MMSTKRKPIKFKRMADALLEERWMSKDLGGGGGGEGSSSSGSDHFPSGSLSDLVNSFLQRAEDDENPTHHDNDCGDDVERDHGNDSDDCSNSSNDNEERKGLLKKVLGHEVDDDDGAAESRGRIIQEIEAAGLQDQIGINCVDSAFKRRLMAHLRQRGYDAGLCKSRWEKSGRYPAGSYEYVDIITSSDPFSRDIIEIFPARQFEIARPTDGYTALLEGFPPIFIGKPDKLKQVVRLMSAAMKESLKSNALPVAPWRRNSYLQAQWFAPYKRTTNVVSARPTPAESPALQPQGKIRRIVLGFVEEMDLPATNCGREFSRKGGKRSGLLAAAFQGKLLESTSSG
ncbi:hypothetical protein V2J09_000490 [Rumex salicifolius]